jgi:prepilin-type N-terminal cleavage/methylation domain-containing protein
MKLYSYTHSGFTLIELLVALFISGIVVTLAASGLVSIGSASQQDRVSTADRLELDRALDFISEEVKMSRSIEVNLPAKGTNNIVGFRPLSAGKNIRPILVLNPSIDSGLSSPIVYYLTDTPNGSLWREPLSIYRWGPTLLLDGNYSDGDGKPAGDRVKTLEPNNPPYYNELVVDGIGDTAPSNFSQLASSSLLECDPNRDIAIPPAGERQGFYVCVDRSTKTVKTWLHKQPQTNTQPQFATATATNRSN